MIFKPGLYIVATPIGNLDDITIRAINTLKNSTLILCEDTRTSQKLLAKHQIASKLEIYNDYSTPKQRELICTAIDRGEIISLISDAGTPLISDPGYKLVRELRTRGYRIDSLPGPSSTITALTLSGLPTDRFMFCGFLPKTNEAKSKVFAELSKIKATLIFFETANRLRHSLTIAQSELGERKVCVARELTKLYQEVKFGEFNDIIEFYAQNPPKGEIVIIISGYSQADNKDDFIEDITQDLLTYLSQGMTAKVATELTYKKFTELQSKKEIYKIANKLKSTNNS